MNLSFLAYPRIHWEKQMVVFNPTVSTKVKYHGNIKIVYIRLLYSNYDLNFFEIVLAFVSNTNEETKRTEDSDYDGKLIKFRIWLVIVPFVGSFVLNMKLLHIYIENIL